MNTYAKLNAYTQLYTTAKCNNFVKINVYNQSSLFWLILIFFFPCAWPGMDLPLARGQAEPVRPVSEQ